MRILALDVGDARIGVATRDPLGIIATPSTAIERTSQTRDIDAILALVVECKAQEIVVGLPLSLNGRYSLQTKSVMEFTKKLEAQATVPVRSVDERYSTVEAESLLRQTKPSRFRSRGEVDAAAAAVILQSYLDGRGVL